MDSILEDSDSKDYIHFVRLAYEKSNQEFYKKLGFMFIEIPKFTKKESELKSGIDRWLFLLKNLSQMKKIPAILNTKIFSKLFQIAAVSNLKKEEFMNYEKDLMASWDEYAIKKTIEHDRKAARDKGIEEGLEEGRKKGREEGREEGKSEVVKNLIVSAKFTIAEIANFANVSESFVRKIKKEIK